MADTQSRAGVEFYADGPILSWLEKTHVHHDAGQQRAFDAPKDSGIPAIMVGPSEGKALELMMRMIQAKTIVEVGTLAGYSAIQLARGLPSDGHVHTIEFDPKHCQIARDNVAAAGLSSKITVYQGAGRDVLPSLSSKGPFCAVFIDADKGNYDHYGRWAAENTRKGGLLIGDNAFFFRRLLEDSPEAAAMRRFHEESRNAYDTVCLPTPDGMLLGVKR
jgi:predicted O-methyltransferase YrrM